MERLDASLPARFRRSGLVSRGKGSGGEGHELDTVDQTLPPFAHEGPPARPPAGHGRDESPRPVRFMSDRERRSSRPPAKSRPGGEKKADSPGEITRPESKLRPTKKAENS